MSVAVDVCAVLVALVNAAAGALGAWRWYEVRPSPAFWRLARLGQATALALALLAGVVALTGSEPDDGLFYLYALLPIAVGFVAEQLRIASAETVLAARGLDTAQDVAALPEAQQRSIALAIVRREMGVMAIAALVVAFLALRALGTAGGL